MLSRRGFFIAGTGTDVGKTVVASWLALQLGADYWKPVQSGIGPEMDRLISRRLTHLPPDHYHPSTYELIDPLSPHEAAKRMGITIDPNRFELPQSPRPLLVEGSGGLMVPMTQNFLVIDLIEKLDLPVILVALSTLGTINHSLLSLELLRSRKIPVVGVVMNGPLMPHNKEAIESFGKTRVLAEVPQMEHLNAQSLRRIHPSIPFSLWWDLAQARKSDVVAA